MGSVKWSWVACVFVLSCGNDDGAPSGQGTGPGVMLDSSGGDGINLDDDADGGEKLDVGSGGASMGGGDCSSGMGMAGGADYSLIWIANSPEGTVSKIDTKSGMELARYWTGPTEGDDDPSRTSVNLAGDVAVTNRGGGITKIAAKEAACLDINGNGTIETSSGSGDVLAWGEDECVIWHLPLPSDGDNRHGPRPTAWDAGAGGDPCSPGDDRVWVGWWDFPSNTGMFRRLDGATGTIIDDVDIPDFNVTGNDYGPYGGAVNATGDLWIIGLWGPLARIDGESLEFEVWDVPENSDPYGIALDANGEPWMGGWNGTVLHFDPASETFEEIIVPGDRRMRGLQVDRDGFAWIAANGPCGVVKVDTATSTLLDDAIDLPGCGEPVGVSIDIDGMVWLPDRDQGVAYKLDPVTLTSTQTTGLIGPYTYSDMTGAGLGLVTNPPQG
jgi:DNA-binding beta-propeller fold protein YncE